MITLSQWPSSLGWETDLNEIIKNLYLGDRHAAKNKTLLTSLGVTRVIVAGKELAPQFQNHFIHLHLPIRDNPEEDIRSYFDQCCEFIDEAICQEQAVYVHCAYGVSRSSSIVIAYLIKKMKISYN